MTDTIFVPEGTPDKEMKEVNELFKFEVSYKGASQPEFSVSEYTYKIELDALVSDHFQILKERGEDIEVNIFTKISPKTTEGPINYERKRVDCILSHPLPYDKVVSDCETAKDMTKTIREIIENNLEKERYSHLFNHFVEVTKEEKNLQWTDYTMETEKLYGGYMRFTAIIFGSLFGLLGIGDVSPLTVILFILAGTMYSVYFVQERKYHLKATGIHKWVYSKLSDRVREADEIKANEKGISFNSYGEKRYWLFKYANNSPANNELNAMIEKGEKAIEMSPSVYMLLKSSIFIGIAGVINEVNNKMMDFLIFLKIIDDKLPHFWDNMFINIYTFISILVVFIAIRSHRDIENIKKVEPEMKPTRFFNQRNYNEEK